MSLASEPDQNPVLKRVTHTTSRLFAKAVAILIQSIPTEEQLPTERLKRLLAQDDYQLYSYHMDGDPVGSALLYVPAGGEFAWLDYMAVRDDTRGRGIGSSLFREIVRLINRDRKAARWLLFEVDDDREGSDCARQTNLRRIEFYRRLGAHLLANVPYRFPNANGLVVPMRLMVYPMRQVSDFTTGVVQRAVQDVFEGIHDRHQDDPLLRWFLERVPSELVVE